MMTRRSFSVVMGGSLLTCCITRAQTDRANVQLRARPQPTATGLAPGTHQLGLRTKRDALLYVPKAAEPGRSAPLIVYLHGATGSEQQGINKLSSFADETGFVLLSPASEGGTWDAIREGYGPDVTALNQALTATFAACNIDASRIALCGFSDGASYALGLGLANGDLFSAVMAFSPGFIPPGSKQFGTPRVFVSHGTADQILPIEECSRRLVPELKRAGYKVTYQEFDGPHAAPREILGQAIKWFLG